MEQVKLVRITDKKHASELRRNSLSVGIGKYVVSKEPQRLGTWALGSCLAIILYDNKAKLGALAHSMLPEPKNDGVTEPGKYVVTAVRAMVEELQYAGANIKRLEAVLVGGARVLDLPDVMSVGQRNIMIAKDVLENMYAIRIVGEDIGGTVGRNVVFDLGKGIVYVWYTTRSYL